jgi:hypothetical protein
MLEFANNLPMVNLLWTILAKLRKPTLSKIQIENQKVQKNDIFTILAAILDLQVEVLLLSPEGLVSPTGNPLLYKNEDSQIVFLNFEDLKKFSVKFKNFKENYFQNPQIRKTALAKIKE